MDGPPIPAEAPAEVVNAPGQGPAMTEGHAMEAELALRAIGPRIPPADVPMVANASVVAQSRNTVNELACDGSTNMELGSTLPRTLNAVTRYGPIHAALVASAAAAGETVDEHAAEFRHANAEIIRASNLVMRDGIQDAATAFIPPGATGADLLPMLGGWLATAVPVQPGNAARMEETDMVAPANRWLRSRTFHNRNYGRLRRSNQGLVGPELIFEYLQHVAEQDFPTETSAMWVSTSAMGGVFLLERSVYDRMTRFIEQLVQSHPTWKIGAQCTILVSFPEGNTVERTIVSEALQVMDAGVAPAEWSRRLLNELWMQMSERDFGHSGSRLISVKSVSVDAGRHQPFHAGAWFPMPASLQNKGSIINIQNADNKCAKYAFAVAAHRLANGGVSPQHANVTHTYLSGANPLADRYANWSEMQFPMTVRDWDKFERKNPEYAVFVYTPTWYNPSAPWADRKLRGIDVLRIPRKRTPDSKCIYLLYVERDNGDPEAVPDAHYCAITNLSRLFNSAGCTNRLRCPYCGSGTTLATYEAHVRDCSLVTETRTVIPPPGSVCQFTNFQNKWRLGVWMVADFECRMVDTHVEMPATHVNIAGDDGIYEDEVPPFIDQLRRHVPVSFALHVYNRYAGLTEHELACPTVIFSHEDPQVVVDTLLETARGYGRLIKDYLNVVEHKHSQYGPTMAAHEHAPSGDGALCCCCNTPLAHAPPDFVLKEVQQTRARQAKRIRARRVREQQQQHDDDAEEEEEEVEVADEPADPEDALSAEAVALIMAINGEDNAAPVPAPAPATASATADDAAAVNPEMLEAFRTTCTVPMGDRLSGEFIGHAHLYCSSYVNDRQRRRTRIPCFFHNGTGYDLKLILRYLGSSTVQDLNIERAYCIAQSSERFKRLDICGVSFVDSLGHLDGSLDTLVKRVTQNGQCPDHCKTIANQVRERYGQDKPWEMLTRKGVFPYAWLTTVDRMEETALPPREAFVSDLSGEGITAEEYAYAQSVWTAFGCRTFRDYHDVYLLTDVWALTDVLCSYIDFGMTNYGLDPTHYASSPAFAQDAMLKITGAKLELLTDMDIFLMFERSIRGGVSMAVHPYARADNKFTRLAAGDDSLSESVDDTFIAALDENNMYGGCMSAKLPVGNFRFVSESEKEALEQGLPGCLLDKDADTGQLWEVDLEFPEHLHDMLNDFPPAPERMTVPDECLSEWQREAIYEKRCARTQKLVPHLGKHERYVVHGHTLKLYMALGGQVTRVYRILTFKQAAVIAPFVALNTRLRIQADERGDVFGVNEAKKNTNVIYGKTLQNVRNYADFRLVSLAEMSDPRRDLHFRRLLAKNSLKRIEPMTTLAVLEYRKQEVRLEQPIYLGSAILDLAKRSIYSFWYETMLPNFPGAKLLYTDTDSLMCLLRTPDLFRDLQRLEVQGNGGQPVERAGQGKFDWSSLDPVQDPQYYSRTNAKVLGMFKPELGSCVATEVVCLRSKMYSVLGIFNPRTRQYKDDKSAAKGVPRQCRAELDYERCLRLEDADKVNFTKIGGRRFDVQTLFQTKEGLAPASLNDKRHLRRVMGEGGEIIAWESFAIGHHATR